MKPPNANETPKCHAHGFNVIFYSVFWCFFPRQKLSKSWIRWCEHKKTFSSITLPFHHIKAELVHRVFPRVWWRVRDQHILRIKFFKLSPNLVLFILTVETPTMLVVNGFTNLHVQSRHLPTKTSVATKELNHITLASLTKPMSFFTKITFSIVTEDTLFIVIFFFNCQWNRIWAIKSRNSNIMPFIMITSDLRPVDTYDSTIDMNIDHSTFLWDNSTSDPSFLPPCLWSNGVSIDRGRPNKNLITWLVRSIWWHCTFGRVMPEISSLSCFLMCLQC